jgi:hypothetical protein
VMGREETQEPGALGGSCISNLRLIPIVW